MMIKTFKAIFAFILVSNLVFAQDQPTKQTLLGGKINKIGIVGSLGGQYTSLNGGFKPAMGGSVSLLFNEKFSVGLAGYGIHDPNRTSGTLATRGMVSGLQLEYIAKSSKLVHVSFPLLVGMGRASSDSLGSFGNGFEGRGGRGKGDRFSWDFENGRGNRTSFFVVQPGINLEVNVLKYLSVFGGVNYRIAMNSNSTTLTNSDLSGLGFQLGIKGGLFGFPLSKLKKKS